MKLNAIVEEVGRPLYVADISQLEFEQLGEDKIEQLVREWCIRHGYTYVDFAI